MLLLRTYIYDIWRSNSMHHQLKALIKLPTATVCVIALQYTLSCQSTLLSKSRVRVPIL